MSKSDTVQQIVDIAKDFLETQPYDIGHDLDHHYAVLNIALDIADHIDEKVDRDVLEVATMWHDVVTDPTNKDKEQIKIQTADYLKNLLIQKDVSSDIVDKTFLAMRYHSYEDIPRNIEGKILYDADKLTTFDLDRWKKIAQAYKAAHITQEHFDKYTHGAVERLLELKNKLHFEYSKGLFETHMHYALSDPWARAFAVEIGLDLEALS